MVLRAPLAGLLLAASIGALAAAACNDMDEPPPLPPLDPNAPVDAGPDAAPDAAPDGALT